ncbi:toxin VasX [Halopseudomonas sabulinigri]|uniref:toxin VasX n=1 Tax=Halopseudomonas sabulinigri TaxID=472181 RepID=UPI000B86B687|nr:toxin VasX [Halopseudomonas sabulinigri]
MSDTSTANHDNGADAKSAVGACPAGQAELFIVPARYALAEQGAEHSCCLPAASSQSHPQALRRLRVGYLYLWHQQGPLRRFAIATDGLLQEQGLEDDSGEVAAGSVAGVALDKHHDAWLLYSEIPLPKTAYQGLADSPAERLARMRCIPLPEIARRLEVEHCPALSEAEKVVAELMPEVRDQFVAHDYAQNGDAYRKGVDTLGQQMMDEPTPERVNAYTNARTWLSEREQAAGRHPQAAEHPPGEWSSVAWDLPASDTWLSKARSQAGSLHAVFATLDDDLGVLRDLNAEQGWVNQREEDWDQENAHKGMIAGFINSLITEDGAELSNLINYRYRDRDIQLTPEQGDIMLQARRDLQPLLAEETEINQRQRHKIGHAAADARIAEIVRREQIVLAPTREFVPADLHGQLQGVVMSYHADKVHNMTDAKSSAQVAERVELPRMQRWITEVAEPHHHWLTARREVLYSDMASYLPRHGAALWYVNYDSDAHCSMLSELSLSSLGSLCSSGPGVQLAVNLLRSPSADQPFSLLSSGFTPSLMDIGDRAAQLQGALTSENQAAIGQFIGKLVASSEKLAWLSALGGEQGNDWNQAVSRLSAAYAALEVEHLASSQTPSNLIQRLPSPLRALLIMMRLCTDSVINVGRYSFTLSGDTGQRIWEFGRMAGQSLQRGMAPTVARIKGMNTLGGVLPLAALLLHMNNVHEINERDRGREHDDVRQREHLAENLKVGAALSAVIGAAWQATGQVEAKRGALKAPIVTLFGFITGGLAAVAAAVDLAKLSAEMQKDGAYWSADHWVRLGHDSALFGLMSAQTGLGAYATYMALIGKWTTDEAIRWFTLRIMPVNWLLLVVEGLYLAWNYHKDTELQAFLEQCCWGKAKRWGDSPEQHSQEIQTLIDLLFKPRLQAVGYLASRQIGGSGNNVVLDSRTDSLSLSLPGASPQGSQLYVKVVAFDAANTPVDCTSEWLSGVESTWLPIHQGMGLRLSGKLPRRLDSHYWQVQVLYHSPLAMQAGTLNSRQLIVGGGKGMRYIVRGSSVVEHAATAGPLLSDAFSALPVSSHLLQPKEI